MAAKKRALEWVGGLASMPSYVTGEGEPFRPELLLWLNGEGAVVGTDMAKPGELLATAAAHLRSTIERPKFGRPETPGRVRVASPELADVLRASHPAIEVVVAATPEIDDAMASMREMMMNERAHDDDESYLAPDIGADAVASFFRATAALFRAKPWEVVPDDQSLFSVTIDALGMRETVMSVIGQMGESHGLVFFREMADFDAYVEAAASIEVGMPPRMPPHFALNFERGADMPKALRKEVAKHHWELAGPNAYPSVIAVDEDLVARPPSALELRIVEAIALALPKVLADPVLEAAFDGGEQLTHTVVVPTSAGAIEVMLRAPYAARPVRPPFDVIGDLFDLGKEGDEIDPKRREELEEELLEKFLTSPEAKSSSGIKACHLVMDVAADYLGMTIAALGPHDLRELLFEIVPRKVSIEASEARTIIEQARAFYAFLKRAYALEQADACLRVLGGDAVKRLEDALSKPSNFGMAKSIMMAGLEAGFDMRSKEGIEAWMRTMQGKPLPASIPLSPFGMQASRKTDNGVTRAKKNQRKATARKKSR